MTQTKQVITGLVLRETPTKEADKILTVLSAELGKISVIAKGARSRRSRFSAAAELLVYSEMTLSQKGEWYYLVEGNTLELFSGIRADFQKLALASYFAELTETVCLGDSSPEILPLLLNALYALSALGKDPELVKVAFTWRLMALAGFEPLCDSCAVCGRPEPETPMLDVVEGILLCRTCAAGNGNLVPLTLGALSALRHILYCEPKRLYAFTLEDSSRKLLDRSAEIFCSTQLERSFRTLDYYKSIL